MNALSCILCALEIPSKALRRLCICSVFLIGLVSTYVNNPLTS